MNNPGIFPPIALPVLSKISVLGPIVFDNNLYVYAMIFSCSCSICLVLYPLGSAPPLGGEHPRAADTLGINVIRTRYYGGAAGRDDGRLCRRLFHAGLGGAFRRE